MQFQPFLLSATDCGVSSRPGRFIRAERTPGFHLIGGYFGLRADLEAFENR